MNSNNTPVFKAERSHTGGALCHHNHRTATGAARCLPALPRGHGTYSMARVIPCNAAARALLAAMDAEENAHA